MQAEPPTEQRDRAVGFDGGVVAEHRGALPIDHWECLRGLLGVLVVADRTAAKVCDETDVVRSGDDVAAVFGEYPCSRAEDESASVSAATSARDRSAGAR